jgi:hypothetical protein
LRERRHRRATDDAVTQIARALQGLTLDDAEHAVRRALAQKNSARRIRRSRSSWRRSDSS